MKPLVLTHHALNERIRLYGLDMTDVERAVRAPEWTEPDHKPGVERRFGLTADGTRIRRVACVEEKDHIRVLSAFPDRNAKRRHDRTDDPRSGG